MGTKRGLKFGWVLFKLGEERWWDWMAFGDAAAVAGVRARARALGRVRGETGEKDLFAPEAAVAGLRACLGRLQAPPD
jgi:hypothetical protein